MNTQETIQSEWIKENSESMPDTTTQHRANCLSDLVAQIIASNAMPRTKDTPINQTEEEEPGVYLLLESGLQGQAVMILPQDSAPNMVDFMLENQPGTCIYLGKVA